MKNLCYFALLFCVFSVANALDSKEDSKQNFFTKNMPNCPNTKPEFNKPAFLSTHPIFLCNRNLGRIEFSQGVQHRGAESLFDIQFIYSQPNRIFRLPARLNIEIGGFFGFGDLNVYNLFIAGLSEEISLPLFYTQKYGNMYIGIGLGIYIKGKSEPRVGSAFTFGERIFIGYNLPLFGRHLNIELFLRHYSNGTLAQPNIGFNFYGISLGSPF